MSVQRQDLSGPCDLVGDATARRLGARPELEVLWPVVIALAVLVVNFFAGHEGTAEELGHYEPMLKHHSVAHLHCEKEGFILGRDSMHPQLDVAVGLDDAATIGSAEIRRSFSPSTFYKTTWLAVAGEVTALEPLTQHSERVPTSASACRTDDLLTRDAVAVHASKDRPNVDDGRVFLNRFQVRRTGHSTPIVEHERSNPLV